MKRETIDKKKVWILDTWLDKVLYILGWAELILFTAGFISGIISTLTGN